MLPDQVSNSGPLTYESGALPIALCDPAHFGRTVSAREINKKSDLFPFGKKKWENAELYQLRLN